MTDSLMRKCTFDTVIGFLADCSLTFAPGLKMGLSTEQADFYEQAGGFTRGAVFQQLEDGGFTTSSPVRLLGKDLLEVQPLLLKLPLQVPIAAVCSEVHRTLSAGCEHKGLFLKAPLSRLMHQNCQKRQNACAISHGCTRLCEIRRFRMSSSWSLMHLVKLARDAKLHLNACLAGAIHMPAP